MKRIVDLECQGCAREKIDEFIDENDIPLCDDCGQPMLQIWWRRRAQRATCWAESESVVVFERPAGTYVDEKSRFHFPARNSKPTPPGMIRHVARSDRELARLERLTGTLNEARHFDKGSGRGFDDYYKNEKVTC